jgi:hypothetical protein
MRALGQILMLGVATPNETDLGAPLVLSVEVNRSVETSRLSGPAIIRFAFAASLRFSEVLFQVTERSGRES